MQYKEMIEVNLATLSSDDLFNGDLFENIKDPLVVLLNCYTNYTEGRGKVYDCSVSDGQIEYKTSTSGTFQVDYKVHYFFGCEDVRSEADHHMKIDFILDSERGTVELTGEYWPEREPDYG